MYEQIDPALFAFRDLDIIIDSTDEPWQYNEGYISSAWSTLVGLGEFADGRVKVSEMLKEAKSPEWHLIYREASNPEVKVTTRYVVEYQTESGDWVTAYYTDAQRTELNYDESTKLAKSWEERGVSARIIEVVRTERCVYP